MNEVSIAKAAEEAILSLALEKCVVCRGTKADDGAQSDALPPDFGPCPDCLGIDGKPTGLQFLTLRVECRGFNSTSHTVTDEVRLLPAGKVLRGPFDVDCEACQGRGWNPVAWKDERTIRLAAEVGGYKPYYISGIGDAPSEGWIVMLTGKTNAQFGWSTELVLAWDKAVKAERGGHM